MIRLAFGAIPQLPRWTTALLATVAFLALFRPEARGSGPTLDRPAPELVGYAWLNPPAGARPTLASRKGKVTLVHFWTYARINCRRNLPIYARWQERYASKGVLVIGVHTPETTSEAEPENVARKVKELAITYPVLLAPRGQNWNGWHLQAWPTLCLVDKQGRARYLAIGEINGKGGVGEGRVTQLIDSLLKA